MARKYFTFPPFILITLINLYYVYIQDINTSRVNTINYSLFVCDKASDCLLYEETA